MGLEWLVLDTNNSVVQCFVTASLNNMLKSGASNKEVFLRNL